MGPEPPATFTSTSILPKRARVSAARRSVCSLQVMSHLTTSASVPIAFSSWATSSIAAVSRPASTNCAPSRAKARVTARPMPVAGAVMTTTLPFRSRFIWVSGPVSECARACFTLGQEATIKDLLDAWGIFQLIGGDDDVDVLLQALIIHIAQADIGNFRMAHVIAHSGEHLVHFHTAVEQGLTFHQRVHSLFRVGDRVLDRLVYGGQVAADVGVGGCNEILGEEA